jgi:hypothetical protein
MSAQSKAGEASLFESLRDFPDWLSPMLVKEFRQGLRAGSFALLLVVLHLGVVLVQAFGLAASVRSESTEFVGVFFWGVVYAVLLLGGPLRALAALHAEREARTLELLGAAGVSGTRLAWGKWISLMAQSCLMAVSLLPYFVLRYYTGGVDLALDGRLLLLAVLASGACVAGGLAASGMRSAVLRAGLWAVFCVGFLVYWGAASSLLSEPASIATLNKMKLGWALLALGSALSVVVFLRLAGDAVGASSEKGAGLVRLLLVAGWGAALVPNLRGVEEPVFVGYLWVMGLLSLAVFASHLSAERVFEAHLRPFAGFGWRGRFAAILLLPNWVGCLWILPLAAAVLMGVVKSVVAQTVVLFVGAFLASGVLLWRTVFPGMRNLPGLFALYGALGGLASAASFALQVDWKSRWLALVPAFGIWRYFSVETRLVRGSPELTEWRAAAQVAFLLYLLACCIPAFLWVRREIWPKWKTR